MNAFIQLRAHMNAFTQLTGTRERLRGKLPSEDFEPPSVNPLIVTSHRANVP